MRCKNCNKEIEEYEIFCEDCKSVMKKASSRTDVKELERLIENQQKLNDLENTKELVDLENLVKEELQEEEKIENTNIIDPNNIENNETAVEVSREEKHKKKSKKKPIIIIVSIICVLVIGIVITLFLFDSKEVEEKEEPITIDYEKVINDYGKHTEEIVKNYLAENTEIPTWQQVSELITYDKYEVACEIHNIYSDGSIYLNACKVDDAEVEFSFGEEKEEIKEGKKVSVYKMTYSDDYALYAEINQEGSVLVGTITCKTEECIFVSAHDKYVVINEEGSNYLYNYETDTMEFGPFNITDQYIIESNVLSYINKLYGIFYTENGINNIYNVSTGKTLKNVKGTPIVSAYGYNPSLLYKYNLIALDNNGKTNFVNLKTGNIGFTIEERLGALIEDMDKKIVYILAYIDNSNNFKIYNSKGKLLFDGEYFSQFKLGIDNLIVATDTEFKVYDKELKLQTSSKKYDRILGIYDDFVVVTTDTDLKILSIEDKALATFEDSWNNDNDIFLNDLSGWDNIENKDAIKLVIENKKSAGSYVNYYYIPSTKESGSY